MFYESENFQIKSVEDEKIVNIKPRILFYRTSDPFGRNENYIHLKGFCFIQTAGFVV